MTIADWWAYGDETGTHEESQFCAVLGYVGSPRQWKLFRRDWRRIVGKDQEFHAQKFFQRESWRSSKSPYHNWSDKKARDFLNQLLDIIHRQQIVPIGFAYDVADFKALDLHERKLLTGATNVTRTRVRKGELKVTDKLIGSGKPSEPYMLGFNYIITEALKAAPANAKVNYVFDRRERSEAWARMAYEQIMRYSEIPQIRDRLGQLSFDDSINCEPLQAADLYAYVWNRLLHESMNADLWHALGRLTRKHDSMGIAEAPLYQQLLEDLKLRRATAIQKALGVDAR